MPATASSAEITAADRDHRWPLFRLQRLERLSGGFVLRLGPRRALLALGRQLGTPVAAALLALSPLRPLPLPATHRGASRSLRSRAAPSGSSASRIARTTTARRAPAATTSSTFWCRSRRWRTRRRRRRLGGVLDQLQAGRRPTLLGRRLPDRPDADLVRPGVALGRDGGVQLLRRVGRQPDEGRRRRPARALRRRHVGLADVDAVGAARADQLGVVVDDEQGPVLVGSAAERLGQRDELLGAAGRLLAELDDVDAAAQRRVEQGLGVAAAGLPSQTK